jgi:hypothetical protein
MNRGGYSARSWAVWTTVVIHSGGSDSEIDPDDVQAQFDEMTKAANDIYEKSAVGVIHSALLEVVGAEKDGQERIVVVAAKEADSGGKCQHWR